MRRVPPLESLTSKVVDGVLCYRVQTDDPRAMWDMLRQFTSAGEFEDAAEGRHVAPVVVV